MPFPREKKESATHIFLEQGRKEVPRATRFPSKRRNCPVKDAPSTPHVKNRKIFLRNCRSDKWILEEETAVAENGRRGQRTVISSIQNIERPEKGISGG